MSGQMRGVVAATLVLWLGTSDAQVRSLGSAPLANARVTHVAVAVRDADATAKTFADVLGVTPPPARIVTLDAPGNQKVQLKVVFLNISNFQIELDQPLGGVGPTQQFLNKFGVGIQHIGFAVQGPLDERVRALEKKGGKLTLGTSGGRYAFVDLTPTLGTTIELVQQDTSPVMQAPTLSPAALASRQLVHVGFVFRDARPAVEALAALLGIPAPALSVFKPIDYLPGVKANPDAHVKFVQLPAGNINIEVIEPVGAPSLWADFLATHGGNAPHHIAFRFDAGDNFDQTVRMLQAKGGVWKKGKRGFEGEKNGSSPEFEFLDTLGMVIEVSGAARPQ